MEEPENIPVNDPPLLDGADDAGEVIVGDHHVGVFLDNLGALDTHGNADVRLLHGRSTVYPVARHGDNVSLLHLELEFTMHYKGRCRVRLFRDDNLDSTFSPQYVDADILRMTFKREVNGRVSNPEILNFDMLQERRQDRL